MALYIQVCKELKNGAKRIWDPEQRVPYAVKGDLWVGYDDSESIKEKASINSCVEDMYCFNNHMNFNF